MPYLTVRTEKNGHGRRVEVKGVAVMGRDKGCDIVLDDKQASRQHARVFSDGRQFYVEDLASRNGVLVNGGKIQGRYPIQDGDEIRIGSHYVKFEDERPSAAAAPSADRLPPRRAGSGLAEARDAVSGAFASFFMFIVSVLIFGATTILSRELFKLLLSD
jgi:pSer/pThr/pTyr-binding forkhead associated (FHA) protein